MKTRFALFLVLSFLALNLTNCDKEELAVGDDLALYNEATATTGFTYYQNSGIIFASSPASGHRNYMRVRFNAKAQSALGLDGRLPPGGSFPNGSVIVKELFDNSTGGTIQQYAVMKKDSTNPNAGVNWLWGEYYADETVAITVTENGSQCISCHSTDDRDYTRLFDLF